VGYKAVLELGTQLEDRVTPVLYFLSFRDRLLGAV